MLTSMEKVGASPACCSFHTHMTDKKWPIRVGLLKEAELLVTRHHYSGRMTQPWFVVTAHAPTGGLLSHIGADGQCGEPIAAVVFSIPSNNSWTVHHDAFLIELSRLVRHPNADIPVSYLISQGVKLMKQQRPEADLLISYADATQGHHGGVYQACSWHYHAFRKPKVEGFVINGEFVPLRTVSSVYGTAALETLRKRFPGKTIVPRRDKGKHLYWKATRPSGKAKAKRLGLEMNPYPKPDTDDHS